MLLATANVFPDTIYASELPLRFAILDFPATMLHPWLKKKFVQATLPFKCLLNVDVLLYCFLQNWQIILPMLLSSL